MAYRDPPASPARAITDVSLSANIVGLVAAGLFTAQVALRLLPVSTWREWYAHGSAMPALTGVLLQLLHVAIVPPLILVALRAPRATARNFAWAAVSLTVLYFALSIAGMVWHPQPEPDLSRPSWAPPKLWWPARVYVAELTGPTSLALSVFAVSRRGAHALAAIATCAVSGIVYERIVYLLERPWIQLMVPDRHVEAAASSAVALVYFALPLLLAIAGIARRRRDADGDHGAVDRRFGALSAAVACIGACAAWFAISYEWAMLARGVPDGTNWMSAAGYVRLEYVPELAATLHGALVASSFILALAVDRAGHRPLAALAGTAAAFMLLVSFVMFMRGRLHVPIDPTYDFENFEIPFAVGVAVALGSAWVVLGRARDEARIDAISERDDIRGILATFASRFTAHARVAIGGAALAIAAVTLAETVRRTDTREVSSNGAAAFGAMSLVLAGLAVRAYRHARPTLDEAARRRADRPASSAPDP